MARAGLMKQLFSKLRQSPRRKPWQTAVIEHDMVGMRVRWSNAHGESGEHRVAWSDVATVLAFKRDLFAVDLVCLAFQTSTIAYEVNEDMENWESLLNGLA